MNVETSSKILNQVAALSQDMICTFCRKGKITYISDVCKQIIGYDSHELLGRYFTELIHPEAGFTQTGFTREVLQDARQKNYKHIFLHKDQKQVHLQWSVSWCEEENQFLCVARDVTEAEQHKRQSESNEHRYKVLFDNNPDIMFIENKEGLVIEANKAFCSLFNLDKEGCKNTSVTPLLPPDMVYVSQMALEQALLGTSIRFDMKLVTQSKEHKIYDTTKHPVVLNGEVVGVQTIAKDITPIVHSYEIIQQQASKLNTVFESITDAFFMLDSKWNFTYINSEAEKMLHLDRKVDIGKNMWKVIPAEVGRELRSQYRYALDTGTSINLTTNIHGHDIWLQVKAFPSAEGLSVYFDDVTDKVKARQELEKLSLVASKTNNSVLIADKEWQIEWVNEGFTRLMGYSPEEAIGRKPSEFLYHQKTDRATLLFLEERIKKGEPVSYEMLNIKKNREEVWLSVEITAIFDKSGELSRYIEVQTDVTALKNSELEHSKLAQDLYRQNSDLQQFTYIVSHNLRAPVANALGLADLLTKVDKEAEVYDLTLLNLNQSILQLDNVLKDINRILSIRDSKGNVELEQVGLRTIVTQTIASLKEPLEKCGGEVLNYIEEGQTVKANKAYLYSIFYNLLSNAIKYRSEDRLLEVVIKSFSRPEKGTYISFSDNGSGFDMKKASKHLFKLYKRFHPNIKGSGVGLYLIKSHLEAMGGHIEVTSEVEAGTSFLIFLPTI